MPSQGRYLHVRGLCLSGTRLPPYLYLGCVHPHHMKFSNSTRSPTLSTRNRDGPSHGQTQGQGPFQFRVCRLEVPLTFQVPIDRNERPASRHWVRGIITCHLSTYTCSTPTHCQARYPIIDAEYELTCMLCVVLFAESLDLIAKWTTQPMDTLDEPNWT